MHTPHLEISCTQTKEWLDSQREMLLLDCRESDEFELVNIQCATLIPMSQITTRTDELEPFRELPIVVYCHHGGRSAQVAAWLRRLGFANAQSMAGGIDQWATDIEPGMARY